jgi:hypothetical protein
MTRKTPPPPDVTGNKDLQQIDAKAAEQRARLLALRAKKQLRSRVQRGQLVTDLARRVVACKHWRWMAGMLAAQRGSSSRVVSVDDDRVWLAGPVWCPSEPGLPDLDDPATLGCLLRIVRDAYGQRGISLFTYFDDPGWAVIDERGDELGTGETEAEALVSALEAAP